MFIKNVQEIVTLINERNPDLIVFTGDLINKDFKLSSKEQEKLILYTCYPFEIIGYKSQRLFVYADKISGPTILEEQ